MPVFRSTGTSSSNGSRSIVRPLACTRADEPAPANHWQDGRPDAVHRQPMDASVPAKSSRRWEAADLIRRVNRVLKFAEHALHMLCDPNAAKRAGSDLVEKGFLREKVVAETAMLLLCADPVRRS